MWQRVDDELGPDADATLLARSAYHKELHTVTLYAVIAVATAVAAVWEIGRGAALLRLHRSCRWGCRSSSGGTSVGRPASPRTAPCSSGGPRRCLSQEELAPRRWAARLAPEELPDFAGFELGRVYQAGTGLMAGDFYDVFRVRPPGSPR